MKANPKPKSDRLPTSVATKMQIGAALVAAGHKIEHAAKFLNLKADYFVECRKAHPEYWEAEVDRALAAATKPPSEATLDTIRRAVALIAAGSSIRARLAPWR